MSIRAHALLIATTLVALTVCSIAAPRSAAFSSILPAADEQLAIPRDVPVDLTGNEVRRAVATYKVDPTGALYEEHSPDTEVPRLGPPKG